MADFALTARQKEAQLLLGGPQRNTLLVGGSRSGKTFLLMRTLYLRALRGPGSRHCVLRYRYNAVRTTVWLNTLPAVQALCFPGVPYREYRNDGFIEIPSTGSQIWFGGLDDKERVEKVLGHEFLSVFFNECSQIPYSSVVVALTRLAQYIPNMRPRAYYDLNPTGTGHWTHRLFMEGKDPLSGRPLDTPAEWKWLYLNPRDNIQNIATDYIKSLESLPERTRRRFLDGQYTAEVDGALWSYDIIERCRHDGPLPEMRRVVIGVDPSGTAGQDDKRNDDIGIIAAGATSDGTAYILADHSCNLGPAGWGKEVVKAFIAHQADAVVAESNFGGEMVRHVIESAAKDLGLSAIPVHLVNASRGKAVRAEPVSALYEQGKVKHAAIFDRLEDQLLNFSTNGWLGEKSPDRADAAIWAISNLLVRTSAMSEIVAPTLISAARSDFGNPEPVMRRLFHRI